MPKTGDIASPGRPAPTQHLSVKLRICAQGCYDLAVGKGLDLDLPTPVKSEASDVVIIVCIQRTKTAEEVQFVLVSGTEGWVLNKIRPCRAGSSRDHKQGTINIRLGLYLKVMPTEIEAGQEVCKVLNE